MPGRFEGMSDAEWELFEDIFPEKARKGRGMPAAHPRNVLNSLLFILMTGCRAAGAIFREAGNGHQKAQATAG